MTTPSPSWLEQWRFDVVLKDGGTVHLRPITPEDADGLQELVGRLSRTSLYNRFFRVKTELSQEELEHFTQVDHVARMAFVAVAEGDIVGVGRYERMRDDPSVAEVAFTVADDQQGRGIGTQLLYHLTSYARTQGISAFRAYVLAENNVMMRVFRNAGFTMRREFDEGVYTVEFPTEGSPETMAAEEEYERRGVAASLLPLFYPQSVAVIGASRDPGSIGGRLFRNIVDGDFSGPVFPVNPKANVVRSVKAYPTIGDVPDAVDLAFIVVPASIVVDTARQCAAKGVRGIVVISAGFSEVGGEGLKLEQELLDVVRDAGMRMVGPNCMGLLNTDPAVSLDGQFGPLFPPRGNVAMSSQSGALGISILDNATRMKIGISTFVSVGNRADISGNDLLLYWEEDPSTDLIVLYLESFGNPRRFARVARRIGRKKPIIAVKSGRTEAGARAASSHTGSLASLDTAVDALFHQAGVIRTRTLSELFDVTALLSNQPVPAGRRVGVLTNAGGPGILAVDALESHGLDVVEFSPELKSRLAAHLAPEASVHNPVDMIASAGPEEYAACLGEMMESDEIDSVIVIFIPATPEGTDEVAVAIRGAGEEHAGSGTTLLSVFMRSAGPPGELVGGEVTIPAYPFPEPAARALAAATRYGEWRDAPHGIVVEFDDADFQAARRIVDEALERLGPDGGWLLARETAALLATAKLDLPNSGVAQTAEEAVSIAERIDGAVVLKVLSPKVLHKSDVGGVLLGLEGPDEVRHGFERVMQAVDDATGVLVQEYVEGGHEVIIGMTEDPNFGPLIAFGLGGIFVELIGDVAFRIQPLTDVDAKEMIESVRSAQLLKGYRGEPPGDVAAVEETLLRVSALIEHVPQIVEMDLNPVKVDTPGNGVHLVDARVRVRPVVGPWVPSRRDIRSEA